MSLLCQVVHMPVVCNDRCPGCVAHRKGRLHPVVPQRLIPMVLCVQIHQLLDAAISPPPHRMPHHSTYGKVHARWDRGTRSQVVHSCLVQNVCTAGLSSSSPPLRTVSLVPSFVDGYVTGSFKRFLLCLFLSVFPSVGRDVDPFFARVLASLPTPLVWRSGSRSWTSLRHYATTPAWRVPAESDVIN